jgi:gliding motility-associated-like protein
MINGFRTVLLAVTGFCFLQDIDAQALCPPLNPAAAPICSNGTVQLSTDSGLTSYTWTPAAGLSNPNISNPVASLPGNYTVTASSPGPELITNGTFGAGNTGFSSGLNSSPNYAPGNYIVAPLWFNIAMYNMPDHTPTNDNLYMCIDGDPASGATLWEEGPLTVQPNTVYEFAYWGSRADQVQPIFEIHFIGNVTGDVIMSTTPGIPYTGVWTWDQYGIPSWNSGANTSVTIRLVDLQASAYGDDFGLDDFSFHTFCISVDSIQVVMPQTVNLGPDISLCTGTPMLDAGAAQSYHWNTGDTTQIIYPDSAGAYWVTIDGSGCSDTALVIDDLQLNPGPDISLCNSPVIDAGPADSYLWNTGDTTQLIYPDSAGTYWVTITINACTATDTINVIDDLQLDLGPDISLCTTNPVLDAGPADSYLWNTGDTTQLIYPDSAGLYWVIITVGACTATDHVNVIDDLLIFLGPDISLCAPSPAINAGPADSYLWSNGDTTQIMYPDSAGTYWVTVTVNTCTASDTINVVNDLQLDLGPDISLCTIAPVIDAGPADSYLWSTGDTTQLIYPLVPGAYWATITSGACSASDTVNALIDDLPFSLGPDISLCTTSPVLDAGAASSYLWSTGDTTQTIQPAAAGTYWATITIGACSASDTAEVLMDQQVNLGADFSICAAAAVTLDAGIAANYLWSTGETTQTISPVSAGVYWVSISTGNCMATDTVQLSGYLAEGMIYIPNSFTPDNNGTNDRFLVYGENIVEFRMKIFNRWGELVFETDNPQAGWDGRYQGEIVQEDVYVYVIEYRSECDAILTGRKTGHVNVLR